MCHADLEWLKDYHCGTGEVSKLASYFIVGNLCKIAEPSKLDKAEVPDSFWLKSASYSTPNGQQRSVSHMGIKNPQLRIRTLLRTVEYGAAHQCGPSVRHGINTGRTIEKTWGIPYTVLS